MLQPLLLNLRALCVQLLETCSIFQEMHAQDCIKQSCLPVFCIAGQEDAKLLGGSAKMFQHSFPVFKFLILLMV